MDTETMSALLGRPLSSMETTNFDLYLKIATQNLEQLLCGSLEFSEDETRTFNVRAGYRVVYTGIFSSITEVKLNDEVTTDYQPYRQHPNFLKAIVFDDPLESGDTVEITADWGFETLPEDLQVIVAKLFGSVVAKSGKVRSKSIEDFSVTYADKTDGEQLLEDYGSTIRKYSVCDEIQVLSGDVDEYYDGRFYNIRY